MLHEVQVGASMGGAGDVRRADKWSVQTIAMVARVGWINPASERKS